MCVCVFVCVCVVTWGGCEPRCPAVGGCVRVWTPEAPPPRRPAPASYTPRPRSAPHHTLLSPAGREHTDTITHSLMTHTYHHTLAWHSPLLIISIHTHTHT